MACRRGYERYLDLRDELDEEDREEQARRRDLPAPEEQDGGQGDTKAESSRRDENFVDRITAVKEESHEMLYVLLDRALTSFQVRELSSTFRIQLNFLHYSGDVLVKLFIQEMIDDSHWNLVERIAGSWSSSNMYQTYFQDDMFVLDLIAGSPGTIFCYFAILNYAQGLQGG